VSVENLSAETAPGVVYERYLREGVLAFQRCGGCRDAVFFPRVLCPACGSDDLSWEESSGGGTVYSVTSLHPRGADSYNVSLIDLDDGFRMMSNVVGIPASEVAIGMRVQAQITARDDEVLPLFVKASE
jgi:uncharacterized OB-fold protein